MTASATLRFSDPSSRVPSWAFHASWSAKVDLAHAAVVENLAVRGAGT